MPMVFSRAYTLEEQDLLEDVVAHSMGGIMVKRALVSAYVSNTFRPIVDATTAVVFLGTPHHGSSLVGWARLASRMVAWAKLRHNSANAVKELEAFSNTLRDVTRDFKDIASRLAIRSFCEQKPTRLPPPEGDKLVCRACSYYCLSPPA